MHTGNVSVLDKTQDKIGRRSYGVVLLLQLPMLVCHDGWRWDGSVEDVGRESEVFGGRKGRKTLTFWVTGPDCEVFLPT